MKIGERFVKSGLITTEVLQQALEEQEKTHERLGDIILKKGLVAADNLIPALSEYFQMPYINLKDKYKDLKAEIIDIIPLELARRYNVIALDLKDTTLVVAIGDPLNIDALDVLRLKTKYNIECMIASDRDITAAIEYCYQNLVRMENYFDNFIQPQEVEDVTESPEESRFEAGDKPVIQYVKSLIIQAVNSTASDILLQPKQDTVDLRFRIDGVLYPIDPPPKGMLAAITTRIKILAGMDIAERRLPQDGRFKVTFGKSTIDIRISSFPTIYGESVVMRLLDVSQLLLGIEQLGFNEHERGLFENLIHRPYGLILVTGPTGSGKTTTLYTALNAIKSSRKNIITLEDPVEYRLPFIQQSQINPKIGFSFASGLRSILRQDPDIIMVGEIRDVETAEIAIHAALTGHLVFSTLHTNDSVGAIVRLMNMNIEPFLISSAIIGVVAQRLFRLICPDCRESYAVDSKRLKSIASHFSAKNYYRGQGCAKCMNSGYKGRRGIFEVLPVNQKVRKYIMENRSMEDMRAMAIENGMKTLRSSAIDCMRQGLTSPDEVIRITQDLED